MNPIMLMKPYNIDEEHAYRYLEVDGWWADKKLDGFACQAIVDNNNIRIYSGTGKMKDWTEKLPWIVEELQTLAMIKVLRNGDILAGELISGTGNNATNRQSISVINGKTETVLNHQQRYSDIRFIIYDVVNESNYYQSLEKRTSRLEMIDDGKWYSINRKAKTYQEKMDMYKRSKEEGWEGLVLKHKNSPYLLSRDKNKRNKNYWIKLKYEKTADVIAIGVVEERDVHGNAKGRAGAIIYGAMKDGVIEKVGKCGGMNDETKIDLWNKANDDGMFDEPMVMEIKYQTIGKDAPLHPRFLRWRTDKLVEDCLLDELQCSNI